MNMPQNGVAPRSSDQLGQILRDLETELRQVSEQPAGEQDFERVEGELHQLFAVAERATLAHELERLDVDRPEVSIEGRRHRHVLRATETYTSAVGPITVTRTLYRAGSEQAVVPLELRAGIIGGHWTPLAARQASYLVAHLTPQECANTLLELGNMSPSKSSLDRLPKQLSSRWEAQREAFEEALRAQDSVPAEAATLAVSLDGVMVPMKDGARQAKRAATRAAGQPTKGPAGYREVGCGTVSCYDSEGERLSTLRCGRMPEAKKETLKHRHVLRHELGGVERVIRGLRYLRCKYPRRKRIKEVWGYFCRNRQRMDYAAAAERGLPIGSGVVEAACKTLATERLKRSGMRWREAGGQAILTLRGWAQSGRFAAAWALLSATYRTEISVSENVSELAHGRAA